MKLARDMKELLIVLVYTQKSLKSIAEGAKSENLIFFFKNTKILIFEHVSVNLPI